MRSRTLAPESTASGPAGEGRHRSVTTQPSLTPAAFAAKWRGATTTEKASAQEHFIDLCRMLGEPTPHEADPIGAQFAFEKRVSKAAGGDGFADVWKRDFFAWECKGRNKDLRAAYVQLMGYKDDLGNPPLLVVSDLERIEIHTNFTGLGGMTWNTRASYSPRYERLAPMLATVIPVAAILASLATAAIYHGAAVRDLVGMATAAVIVTGVARQVHLYMREARALAAEHRAGVGLAAEISERAATLFSLQRLTPGATLEETAREVCREALRLDGIDLAVIRMYGPDNSVVPVAVEGLGSRAARLVGHPLMPAHAARVRARALDGLWERSWDEVDNPYQQTLRDLGIDRTVNAVLRWHDAIIGDIGLGTCSVESAPPLRERLSTAEEFAVVASALLGPAKAERDHADAVRRAIRGVLEALSL